MANFKTVLKSENVDESLLSQETRDTIKEYKALESSRLKTVRKADGSFTDNAQAKLNRLNKVIIDGIAEFVTERDAKRLEAERLEKEAKDKEALAEQARLDKEEADRLAEEARIADEEAKTKAEELAAAEALRIADEKAEAARLDVIRLEAEAKEAKRKAKAFGGLFGGWL